MPIVTMALMLAARWVHLALSVWREPASGDRVRNGPWEWQVAGLACAYLLAFGLWARSWPSSWAAPASALDGAAVVATGLGASLRVAGQRGLGPAFSWGTAAPPLLVTGGIYRYVKHPLLAGYALECLGMLAAARGSLRLRAGAAGLLAVSVVAQGVREERALRRAFGEAWEQHSHGKPV